MNSSTRLVYKSCRNDGTSALKLAEIMWKNKLVNVVVFCFFIYEAGNFWNNPRIIVIVISLEHCTGVRRYWFVEVQVQV